MEQQVQQARRRGLAAAIRVINWASQPKRNRPRVIPGLELELSLLALHVVIGVLEFFL